MNFIRAANDSERGQATEMLNTIDDINSHENSPTKDMNEGEDNRSHRMRLGHLALVNLQGLMATQLQGCSWDGSTTSHRSWFGTAFLMTWTMLLVGYSWYMMRRSMDFRYIGAAMRYQQMQRWLETCLHHLPTASLQDRERTLNSLSEEHDLSEDDSSPSYRLGKHERDLLPTSHEEVHRCIVRLLELQRVEVTMDLLRTFAEIFKDPEIPDPDSDESMREETRSERLRRYQNAEQGEVSDPDAWAALHYGRPPPAESADEETPKKSCKSFESVREANFTGTTRHCH